MSEAKNLKMMGLVWNLFGYGKLLGASPKEEFTLILESDDTTYGKLSEWSKEPHSKCGVRIRVPGVRIPHFPQLFGMPDSGIFVLMKQLVKSLLL